MNEFQRHSEVGNSSARHFQMSAEDSNSVTDYSHRSVEQLFVLTAAILHIIIQNFAVSVATIPHRISTSVTTRNSSMLHVSI